MRYHLFFLLMLSYTPSEWLELLGKDRYRVMRQKGTERSFSGAYLREERKGIYSCAACKEPLFLSKNKYYEPNSGWPAFTQPIEPKKVYYMEDRTLGFKRYEVLCRGCNSHLGHLFKDGPPLKYLRYTINSIALIFEAKEEDL
jgi:peptide-methionine (R)-S-oxide reductase